MSQFIALKLYFQSPLYPNSLHCISSASILKCNSPMHSTVQYVMSFPCTRIPQIQYITTFQPTSVASLPIHKIMSSDLCSLTMQKSVEEVVDADDQVDNTEPRPSLPDHNDNDDDDNDNPSPPAERTEINPITSSPRVKRNLWRKLKNSGRRVVSAVRNAGRTINDKVIRPVGGAIRTGRRVYNNAKQKAKEFIKGLPIIG